ncbi:monocarboxylate transporter 13-like isoform X1 [Clavelina lepadiformis]|uniref:monocarboxylate transporter 13-like isoform X1 n=1 Tax=Clavelina lepadiformis TaxID=159417 RepID=UPI0040432ADF
MYTFSCLEIVMVKFQLDGGWGWMVLIGSFFTQAFMAALYFSYGVVTESWIREFNSSTATTALVGSTASGFTSMTAPIGSFLVNRWGCRTSNMLGAALVTLGLFLCSQAKSLPEIFVYYGIFGGTGFGLCYVPAVISLTQYFQNKRSLAIGIASSGVGVGSFVFPIFIEALQVRYTWRGAMLILSGVIAHEFVSAMVIFPVERKKGKGTQGRKGFSALRKLTRHPWLNRTLSMTNSDQANIDKRHETEIVDDKPLPIVNEEKSYENDHILTSNHEEVADDGLTVMLSTLSLDRKHNKDSFSQQSRLLFCNPLFYLIVIGNFTMFVGMMIVYGLTPIRATSEFGHTSEQGALLVSIIGLSNTVGRFGWGALTNVFPRMDPVALFITLRTFAAVLTCLSPLATSFSMQIAYCTLVGLAFGCWSLYPIVLLQMFGDMSLNIAFGYLEVLNGVGSLVGPTLGGLLYDITKSYNISFIFGGATLAVGNIVLTVGHCACASKYVNRQKDVKSYESSQKEDKS